MTRSITNIISYLFSKLITVRGYAFLLKSLTNIIKMQGFALSYILQIQVLSRFRNKYGYWNKPSLRIINNSSQNTLSLFSDFMIFFVNDQVIFFEIFLKSEDLC